MVMYNPYATSFEMRSVYHLSLELEIEEGLRLWTRICRILPKEGSGNQNTNIGKVKMVVTKHKSAITAFCSTFECKSAAF